MHYLTIPRTSLSVSAVCLGTAGQGILNTDAEAFAVFDRYLELGGTFIETARVYSDWVPGERGRSERILGDWMASRKVRDRVILSTKGGHPLIGIPDVPWSPRLSPAELAIDVAASLAALRTDVIDLYYLHRDDERIPVSEIIDTLEAFVAKGNLRYYACSNWTPQRIDQAMRYAQSRQVSGFVTNQVEWHMALRHATPTGYADVLTHTDETEAVMREHRIAAVPHSSQANGFFSKFLAGGAAREKAIATRYFTPPNEALANRLRDIAKRHAVSIEALVLGFFATSPLTVIPAVGPHRIEHLESTMAAINTPLTPACLQEIARAHDGSVASDT